MSDDESFVILGSTPTPSMEHYNGFENGIVKENGSPISNNAMMQSSTQTINNFSLTPSLNPPFLSATEEGDNLKNDSLVNSLGNEVKQANQMTPKMEASKTSMIASGGDFAEQFLLGEIPADSLKYSIWKHFPSLCTTQTKDEDIGKLESLISEHIKLKDNLHKTNEAMHQHFSTINEWQNKVKELKENQAAEIAKCNTINANLQEELRLKIVENDNLQIALTERDEFNQKLKQEITRIIEQHEEKTLQFNMNMAYAAGENKDLVQEISAKNAVIQNMTQLIEKLEKQTASFELVSVQRNEQQDQKQNEQNSSMDASIPNVSDFATQLNAAREQNVHLLEQVSNKISTIRRLENESSKLQHQLLSLEMIVSETGEKANEDSDVVQKLKDEINTLSTENDKFEEKKNTYIQEISQLKEHLAREQDQLKKANNEIQVLVSRIATKDQSLSVFTSKVNDQQAELTELQKANVLLRSKEINADIRMNDKDKEVAEIKEENAFLKAQLDVYKSDFEMERQARQDIANEREELLSDLKLLQRRNQQLIDEAQSRRRSENGFSSSTASAPSHSAVNPDSSRPSKGKFVCPVCNSTWPNLMTLQNHVQNCLEN